MKKQLLGILFVIFIAIVAVAGICYFAVDDLKTDQAILNLADLKVNDQSDHLAPVDLPIIIDYDLAPVDLPVIEDDISMDSVPKVKDLIVHNDLQASDDFSFQVYDSFLDGDILTLRVAYSGGCSQHGFGLYWDGTFLETGIPSANIQLLHNSNGDLCEAYIMEDLQFDISKLKAFYMNSYDTDLDSFSFSVIGVNGDDLDFQYE